MIKIPKRFVPAYEAIDKLKGKDRYLAAFVFGSVARGEAGEDSDLDVKVIVDCDSACKAINHPVIGGAKLDISFESFEQLRQFTKEEITRGSRIPMLAESIIVFDRTGELAKYKTEVVKASPKELEQKDKQWIQFMVYHADNKAERLAKTDPAGALLAMGINVNEIIKFHYQINRKWWVSNKRMMNDLRTWDMAMATQLEKFVSTRDVGEKFSLWTEIVEHVLRPLGGRLAIAENNCGCEVCKEDLEAMLV
ncbi:hypothetical protein A2368_02085 [Candidatus Collierbacteria bacterium RIFOXYB1_FULL_49_13]|uniref:Polymerase nucleotidyl transferase domain-containing protein n=1 Tax=Candidatus Collierbacteria bacterium RIFOXYB1_FULL_49_13 TaxID=1817728 RepID=A0A1F5FGB4_9BACT|nr:MAG: hypothetical protein A2368_02085 [Candidatus Collierbacteria bacterium RIFOXYB1_FULL_49_13]